uniref:RING-type domain-containing protein n=1 Tax=Meloidogyne javanica TaxID=6303 RepID=A0A915MM77_MELJA
MKQARMEFWSTFSKNYNLKQYRELIGRALIVKGAKTEEIEYKLNKMRDKEALDLLRDYYEYCHQKIKDIEKEVKEKANKQLQHLLMSEFDIPYSSLPEDDKICWICHEEFEEYVNNEKIINKLKCGHIFHQDCVINWALSDNENRYKCPLCREEIEFNEAHKEFKEKMKKAGFTFDDDVEN